ncbi:type-F conjugative transfer system pilin assembly protein TrbC [Novosphingobium sp. PC22D]|jgi:conjugal transfer pilus assembly protein TrbC|uniref:Type-F conjugative transfer system pilin assembly protein TrbC n=2 Tax=Novosphingobium TaxID=165696 RepID=A0ABQ2JUC5_9SPHN|nr:MULTISPECIES: type-F conjugative transfer system pilin assembly protein TrbC [Novosphingobium]MCJ2180104.1 type-F conjugative transfer system pilin assembly protein TrbC [Novosphingobium album (ex Hu et al. 2023)]PEQ11038.1 type-F conjugative transfer system pilin assembly protein TrbC [Novosphingobium sp. PC22D]GGN55372.1 hypothetical protein GCM10011349_31950 [Novosphingobium indicum]
MRKSMVGLGGVLAIGIVSAALAQTIDGLDLQAVEKRAENGRQDAQDVFDFVTGQGDPPAAAAREVVDNARDRIADLDVSAIGKSEGPVNLDELVAGAKSTVAGPKSTPLIMAFVSLSMPGESLRRTIADTTKAGGVVIFRGFSAEGPKPFVEALSRVVDQKSASNIAIDPRLFRAFKVDRVPTIVAASTNFEPCDQLDCVTPAPPHDRISGNVSLAYALQEFVEGRGPGAPAARVALANLTPRQ